MAYLPNNDSDRGAMLDSLGLRSSADLFESVPPALRNPALELPEPLAEQDLVAELERLARRNRTLGDYDSFLGAGVYRRFIPAIVRSVIGRPEFYTAYTPYQAEASQGTLQTIFEFQSVICALTNLDFANASLYDGATAAAEAMLLAVAHTGRTRVALSRGLHPETLKVLKTFASGRSIGIDLIAEEDGATTPGAARAGLSREHAALIVAQPGFSGVVEDTVALAAAAHSVDALAVCAVDPLACSVLLPPGEAGFDVAVGDGQPLGIPPSFGGPHVGFISVSQDLLRRIPGRLVGMTRDAAGRRAFTLTLQAREQHIRRERATSNICTNHALMALAVTAYAAHMGAGGMRAIAEVSAARAHHLALRLAEIDGFALAHPAQPFLWEFVLRCPMDAETCAAALRSRGILAGLPLGRLDNSLSRLLLVCCTETTSIEAINHYVGSVAELAAAIGGPR